jgi:hypothetical protein
MIKKPIRNLHSDKLTPPRFCDVIIDGDKIYLEQKKDKNIFIKIPWEDVVYQVECAKAFHE